MKGLRYDLKLGFRADSLDFDGTVRVEAQGLPTTLELDAKGLAVHSVDGDAGPIPFQLDAAAARLRIGPMPAGASGLTIRYSGRADDGALTGLYVSPLGAGRLLTTDLEPTSARQLWPCFDRPDAKAVFALEITFPADLVAITNTPPVASELVADGRRRVRFAPTPPMAPYLVYVGVGPFEEAAGASAHPKVIVATARGRSAEGRFGVEQAERILAYYERYFGLPYPLPKLHLVAVPHYGSGAMENWGAITFQEFYLLLGARSSTSTRQELCEVLAHEIAHQWFGNLVTMRGWSDLWLNESFATFAGFRAVDALFPEWHPWEAFLLAQTSRAMTWDALPHTHPVHLEVSDPDQVQQIFDEISYGKGASVLRMVDAYLGETRFREGVTRYLGRHQWANAEAADLWHALAEASGEPVDRLLEEWVGREGFPVVRVARTDGRVVFSQSRFALGPSPAAAPWPIPLTFLRAGRVERGLFETPRLEVAADDPAPVLVNPGRTGFYRVQYDGPLRGELLHAFATLPAVDRWGLLDDALALFLAGNLSLEEYLPFLQAAEGDPDPFVAGIVPATMTPHYPLLRRIPAWEAAVRRVAVAQTERLGLEKQPGESERTTALREELLDARLRLDPGFARQLAARFPEVDAVGPELVGPILKATALEAGDREYALLLERLARAPSVEESRRVAAALALLPRDEWVGDALERLFDGRLALGAWNRLSATALIYNPERGGVLWPFLKRRMADHARLTAGSGQAGRLLRLALPILGLDRPEEVRAWATTHRFTESGRGVVSGLELLDVYRATLVRAGVPVPSAPSAPA